MKAIIVGLMLVNSAVACEDAGTLLDVPIYIHGQETFTLDGLNEYSSDNGTSSQEMNETVNKARQEEKTVVK
jgi:hypothetical protein